MDAVEYLKAKTRMMGKREEHSSLSLCNNELCKSYHNLERRYPEKAVETVEEWAKEHPAKTRQSEFLKIIPNSELDNNGVIKICPKHIDTVHFFPCDKSCESCRKEFWLEEVDE